MTFFTHSYRAIALACLTSLSSSAAPATLTVDMAKTLHPVSPSLFGIFFEDINCSADGGLYAELVRNRNFEDGDKADHWDIVTNASAEVSHTIDKSAPVSPKNPRSLRVEIKQPGTGRVALVNNGFWGISVEKGHVYELSLLTRSDNAFKGGLTATLESQDGVVYAKATLGRPGTDWKAWRGTLKASKTDPKARLVISTDRPGTFWLDMVSLFPRKTWKNRENGLRTDLAQMLSDLKPAFMRFPGGCWVEGDTMKDAYRWKETIGPLAERRTQYNIWQYHATHGLGYHEYLQMCEDLDADALFVINCGMSHKETVPMDKMGEFVQDALDSIEYAKGPVNSKWGAVRAANGHPAPFNLKYLQVGNENGGPAYSERYALFHDAIKAKYPEIVLVANEWAGGRPSSRPLQIVDEHYYSTPEFFINNAGKYDTYDRSSYKIYVGEYAVTQNGGQGNLRAAIGEAAFMTGMERNSDVVVMASYAPLFANVNYKRWNPDLINFDSSRAYGLPGYYVQKLFSLNRADHVLALQVESPETKTAPRGGAVGVGTWLTQAEFKDLKVTKEGQTLFTSDFSQGTKGLRMHGGNWSARDGLLRQTSLDENVRAFVGDRNWRNYTYTLKARKTGGREGFLIPFLVQDEGGKCWWNIGGWGNARHGLEINGVMAKEVPGSIETGRWYDIRIEVTGGGVKCFLDDKLIHDAIYPKSKSLHAVAGKAGIDLILKVVNVSTEDVKTDIRLTGGLINRAVEATVLTSENPEDENTLEQPGKVSPVTRKVTSDGSALTHVFPPNSLTILRAKEQR